MGVVRKDLLELRKFLESKLIAEFDDGVITDTDIFGQRRDGEKGDPGIVFHHISGYQALSGGKALLFLADTVEQVLQRNHSLFVPPGKMEEWYAF